MKASEATGPPRRETAKEMIISNKSYFCMIKSYIYASNYESFDRPELRDCLRRYLRNY